MKKITNSSKFYLTLILVISITIITLLSLVLIFITKNALLSSIFAIISLTLTIVLLQIKNKFDYLKHEEVLVKLLNNSNKEFKIKNDIYSTSFIKKIMEEENFNHHLTNKDYSIYYKIEKEEKRSKKNKTLYAILILHKEISFIDDISSKAFESLEQYLYKKEKYKQRIFYQFKESNYPFTTDKIQDTNKIFFLSLRRENIIVLNILYNKKTSYVYYLNSNSFKKPIYLNTAYNYLEKFFK